MRAQAIGRLWIVVVFLQDIGNRITVRCQFLSPTINAIISQGRNYDCQGFQV